jgi:hypothetical protein
MNVSSNGMAVKTPVPLRLAETMDIVLLLPQTGTVRATGIVIWDDKHGKVASGGELAHTDQCTWATSSFIEKTCLKSFSYGKTWSIQENT